MAACARTSNIMKALSLSLALGVLTLAPLLAEEAKKLTPTEELLIVTRFEENGQEAAEASFKPFVEEFKNRDFPRRPSPTTRKTADRHPSRNHGS